MRVVVCLPTRNEHESIESMVRSVRALNLPLFITDGDSTDGTLAIARRLKVPIVPRPCPLKGCGVYAAIAYAIRKNYDALVFIDCDNTYPVNRIPDLVRALESADMVVGVRNFENVPRVNRIGNIIHTLAINLLYLARLRDINSGLRAIRVEKFKGLIDAKSFDVEAQLTVRALKKKLRVREVRIRYNQRTGQSKLRLQDGITILWRIIKERFMS